MGRRAWTTPEQYAFLDSFLEEYRSSKDITRFLQQTTAQYFKKWPEQLSVWPGTGRPDDAIGFTDLPLYPVEHLSEQSLKVYADAVSSRKGQIKSWLKYHASKKTGSSKITILKPQTKTRKGLSQVQAYSKLFKESKKLRQRFEEQYPQYNAMNDFTDDDAPANTDDTPDGHLGDDEHVEATENIKKLSKRERAAKRSKESLKYYNRFVRECYNEATEEEKQQVEDYRKQFKEELIEAAANVKADFEKDAEERKPEELQRTIEGIHHTIQPMADLVALKTGLNVFVCLGGPIPEQGGRIGFIQ
ncbi:hypothetical protein NLI96_g12616 [Meripilus lineatus]|uniref:Uncharacterized protein n=1 Tax=Meripilus lineatus TaxID=2056292 RepID=A0AAD5UTJ1_9APHY|nr:hypothetical protein NLI96_g12616 [Physisporinus lineatus]